MGSQAPEAKVVAVAARPASSLLAALLLRYQHPRRLYLDLSSPPLPSSSPHPPPSTLSPSLMTGGRADRQIYLHWWQKGRRGRSHQPIPLSSPGPREGGALEENPLPALAPPRAGHISAPPRPLLRVLSWMGPKPQWPQTHTLPHQPLGRREGQEERDPALEREKKKRLQRACTLADRHTAKAGATDSFFTPALSPTPP